MDIRVVVKIEISNPLPNDKILALSKLKVFLDDKLNVTQNIEFVFFTVENIFGKGKNACYQHVLSFQQYFQRLLPQGHQQFAEPHRSVGSVADLITGGRWFIPGSANILSEDL